MAAGEHQVFKASRRKWAIMGVVGVMFVAQGTRMVMDDNAALKVVGWITIVLFGLGLVIALIQLLVPDRLILSSTTLTVTRLRRPTSYVLADCSNFRSWTVSPWAGPKVVVFNYSGHARRMPRLDRRLSGADFSLPDTYGQKPEDLAELLNAAAARAQDPLPGTRR